VTRVTTRHDLRKYRRGTCHGRVIDVSLDRPLHVIRQVQRTRLAARLHEHNRGPPGRQRDQRSRRGVRCRRARVHGRGRHDLRARPVTHQARRLVHETRHARDRGTVHVTHAAGPDQRDDGHRVHEEVVELVRGAHPSTRTLVSRPAAERISVAASVRPFATRARSATAPSTPTYDTDAGPNVFDAVTRPDDVAASAPAAAGSMPSAIHVVTCEHVASRNANRITGTDGYPSTSVRYTAARVAPSAAMAAAGRNWP